MAVNLHGGVDILVSNAAVNPFFGNIIDATEEVWDKNLGPYNVSKTALLGLTKNLAVELAPRNIRVNCLRLDSSRLTSARCCGWIRQERST
uniref:Dehydrogenase/reductase (SDR family) member 4 n=2 Tax=Sus scrofa TaxID=9823 RepID=A0A8D0V1K4_PIG